MWKHMIFVISLDHLNPILISHPVLKLSHHFLLKSIQVSNAHIYEYSRAEEGRKFIEWIFDGGMECDVGAKLIESIYSSSSSSSHAPSIIDISSSSSPPPPAHASARKNERRNKNHHVQECITIIEATDVKNEDSIRYYSPGSSVSLCSSPHHSSSLYYQLGSSIGNMILYTGMRENILDHLLDRMAYHFIYYASVSSICRRSSFYLSAFFLSFLLFFLPLSLAAYAAYRC